MKGGRGWLALPEARWLAIAGLLAIGGGYQIRRPVEISLGSGLLAALSVQNFHDAEGAFRWTRAESSLSIPDPGPGLTVRVEADLSGFRPPGHPLPLVSMEAGGAAVQNRPSRRGETLSLQTVTRGWWKSDLEVRFRSETFTPGGRDRRPLGVRVQRVRLLPAGPAVWPSRPPVRQIALATTSLLLLFGLLVRYGIPPRWAFAIGGTAALGSGLAYGLARPYAALASTPIFFLLALITALARWFPSLITGFTESLREAGRAAGQGLQLLTRWPAFGLIAAGTLAVTAAYMARPVIEIDLGSGRETTLAPGFADFDAREGRTFRRALRGARLELRDFGGGATWRIAITASLGSAPRPLLLAAAGPSQLKTFLQPEWTTAAFEARSPVGWRSGLTIHFPSASEAIDLGVDRVRIERGRSFPSLRALVYLVGAALFLAVGFRASGLSLPVCFGSGALLLGLETTALVSDPLLALPFSGFLCAATASGAALAALVSGLFSVASRRGFANPPAPAALAAASLGFVTWLSASAFPLFQGGHFVFHSSIAEEIWQGKFLTYYLPYPGSMLSRQAQWGGVLVPHPCLYHTLMAPLAALPQPWFYLLEKVGLALMLASMSLAAALIAGQAGNRMAGSYAGWVAASLPPTFQLLGLGHLMTLFGCWAATLALCFVILRFERLPERSTWVWAFLLFTLCFLSYTGSLLFTVSALLMALPFLLRRFPASARALAGASLAAGGASFLLYYMHWAWPFARESIPALLASSSAGSPGIPWLDRLSALPRKLSYTYGSLALPAAGLAGIFLAPFPRERFLVGAWAVVLVAFSGLDLSFNFLLKHHYFVMAPISVGAGLLLAWVSQKGAWGRLLAVSFIVYSVWTGGRAAMEVAMGKME